MKQNRNVFRMLRYFFRCKKATIYACIMCGLGLLVGIITPICNKLIQEDIIPNKNISLFIWLTIVILLLNVVSTLTSFFNTKIYINNGIPITSNIRKDIMKMNTFSKKNEDKKGKVLISSTAFLEEGNSYYISYMYIVFDCILKFMFYLPFFFVYGKQLALIMIIFAILSFVALEIAGIFTKRNIKKSNDASSERYDYTLKMLKKMQKPDFKEDETYNYDNYMSKVYKCDKTWINYCNVANLYGYIFNLIWYIGVGICFYLAFDMMATGAIILSTFIVFNSYLEQLKGPIGNCVTYKQVTDRFNDSFENFFELLDDDELLDLKKIQD